MTDARLATVKEGPSLMRMMEKLIQDPDSPNAVAALKELVALKIASDEHQIKMDRISAERAFSDDYVSMKGEMPTIYATQEVKDDGGGVRFRFAGRAEILRQARSYLTKWGFAESYTSREENGKTVGVCILTHKGGHKVSSEFACDHSAPPKTGASQGSLSTLEYATRGALCTALGIVTDKLVSGADQRLQGDVISPEQAEALRKRVRNSSEYVSEVKLLQFAEAKDFEEIREARYRKVIDYLDKADAKRKPTGEMF